MPKNENTQGTSGGLITVALPEKAMATTLRRELSSTEQARPKADAGKSAAGARGKDSQMTEYAACKEAAEIAHEKTEMLRRVMEKKDALHPNTRQLVRDFSAALADKLAKAEQKYGYRDNWLTDDWEADCRAELMRHIEKGDPLDVAAYCAFMWRRGWPTV